MATLGELIHVVRRVEKHYAQDVRTEHIVVRYRSNADRQAIKTLLKRRGKVNGFGYITWQVSWNVQAYTPSDRRPSTTFEIFTLGSLRPVDLSDMNVSSGTHDDSLTVDYYEQAWGSLFGDLYRESISERQIQEQLEREDREARTRRRNIEREQNRSRTMTEQMRSVVNRRGGGRW